MQAKAPALMQRHTVVPSWQGSPGYVDVVAKLVAEQLDSLDDISDTTTVLFSAHGVPVSYVEEAGDPYKRHIEETVAKVTENVKRYDLGVPRCCGAFTPSTRVVSRRGGRGWFLFRF